MRKRTVNRGGMTCAPAEAARNIKSVVEGDKAMFINCRIFLYIIATCGSALYVLVCGAVVGGLMVAV